MNEIIDGAWLACLHHPHPLSSPPLLEHSIDELGDREKERNGDGEREKERSGERKREKREYYADVILCNPPVPIHVHLAEKLQIPLQIWFPMPWSQVPPLSLFLSFFFPPFSSSFSLSFSFLSFE